MKTGRRPCSFLFAAMFVLKTGYDHQQEGSLVVREVGYSNDSHSTLQNPIRISTKNEFKTIENHEQT